ncbi:hypothetical protein BDF20DRAFT_635750 [Mycotypha africana]|uniref:uncharacterized protein n=1 Tax=Mycotypha africana TaxID=64632 RepID=UPI002300BD4B|nr:uncharacterized protein BDF20DRAFT_635750 [Mycotypha africana]KAI8973246.1 hypothetical protein BDF20DRAFT_635750 [Mycotypha africana]
MTLYNTISTTSSQDNQRCPYAAALPPDPLERFGSAHLDQDIFGVTVSRLSLKQQLEFVRNILLITTSQVSITCCMVVFISQICPLYDWLEERGHLYMAALHTIFSTDRSKPSSVIVIIHRLYKHFRFKFAKLFYVEGLSIIVMTLFGLFGLIFYTTCQHKYQFSGFLPFVIGLGGVSIGSLFSR